MDGTLSGDDWVFRSCISETFLHAVVKNKNWKMNTDDVLITDSNSTGGKELAPQML